MIVLSTVAILVLAVNVVSFTAFGIDKLQARRQRWRLSEATLLGLAWATGLVGGWLGMSAFRHKTRKRSFVVKMTLVSILNPIWPLLYLVFTR